MFITKLCSMPKIKTNLTVCLMIYGVHFLWHRFRHHHHDHSKSTTEEEASATATLCKICYMETRKGTKKEMFNNQNCSHTFCSDCIHKYIAAKIKDGFVTVTCPGLNCTGTLEPISCRDIIAKKLFDKWCAALCESMFPASERLYCPFNNCSAMLVLDRASGDVTDAICPHCGRMFCAVCMVGWHSGFTCVEFQRLGNDERETTDLQLMNLAKDQKWRRCPNCSFYVEKQDGCLHITCRCKYEFCYRCGVPWGKHHDGNCKRRVEAAEPSGAARAATACCR